jgi:site-specific DNA-methyltransferase (adenine-specific)
MLDFGFYNMDCMQGMAQFPDKYFDLAIVDPPYGRKEHGGKKRSRYVKQKNGTRIFVKDGEYKNKGWDNKPTDKAYFEELMRVSKNQIIFGCNYFDYPLTGGRIVWDKCNDGSCQSDCEIAYCSLNNRVDIFRFMWRGMFQGKSISEGTIQQGNKALNEKRIHPTQKPIAIYKWILLRYAKAGDKILDTHVGSASSLIACHRLGFNYVGFELDTEYYNRAKERLDSEIQAKTIKDFIRLRVMQKGADI